jgi:hypothetical protein
MESNTWCPRLTAAMILSGSAVQGRASGCRLCPPGNGRFWLEVDNRADDAAFEAPFDEIGENALDGIQPQVRGRNEVEPEALVPSARDSAFRSV